MSAFLLLRPIVSRLSRVSAISIFLCVGLSSSSSIAQTEYVFLEHPEYIKRLAMDLKAVRPTEAEMATSPEAIEGLVDSYMETPEFLAVVRWLANDIFLTRFSFVEYFRDSYDYEEEESRWDVALAVGEEPIRLFEYIVKNDLPLTELVTADYTVANATLAWFWDIDYPGPYYGSQWMKGRYKDGRQHAGVLSQTSFFYRYPTTLTNRNRHRANQITRIFLDDDHFLRDVSLDQRLGAADPNLNLLNAARYDPGCVACHCTLDGIGAHLFGYSYGPEGQALYARETFAHFSPQGVQRSLSQVLREPNYYGYPSGGLKDLGNYIAKDPRFARTMVKHIYRFLLHRNLDYRDRDLLNELSDFFVASDFNTKALIKEIVTSQEYRAVGVVGSEKSEKTEPESAPLPPKDLSAKWKALEAEVMSAKIGAASKAELLDMIRVHAIETGYSQRAALDAGVSPLKSGGEKATAVEPQAPEDLIQPFKLATPEQLHSLGKQLVGEIWNGWEAGQWMPEPFPHLEYNTDVKIAAGGYDGRVVIDRRWSVPPTYLLVLERWAEVIAEDVAERELGESVHWSQRTVFTLITGKEEPQEAEPAIRAQIADWFKRFYGETVDPWGADVDDVFGILLLARDENRERFGDWYSIEVAWSHVLGTMLSDVRIALY
jgi:hypothetical protein